MANALDGICYVNNYIIWNQLSFIWLFCSLKDDIILLCNKIASRININQKLDGTFVFESFITSMIV